MYIDGPDPVEERAVRDQPTDEEDAGEVHVSAKRCARTGQVLEPAQSERRDHDRDRAERERHQEREPDLAAECGVPQRDDAPVGRQDPGDRVRPRRQDRRREDEAGRDPDRVLEQVRHRVRVAVEHECRRQQQPEEGEREHDRRHREHEQPRVREVERHAEDHAAPDERRRERVGAGERVRERERQVDEREVDRRGDTQFERSLPALPLDHPARREERRRPDAHHPGAERCIEQRARRVRRRGTCSRRSSRRSPAARPRST